MKKAIIMWIFSFLIGTATFANNEVTVSQKVQQAFNKEFVNAKEVHWEKNGAMDKATFTINDQVMFAYYSEEGDLLAIARNISSDRLPIALATDLKKTYNSYWISDLFEMVSGDNSSYYVTVENANYRQILKSDNFGHWSVYKKEKKNVE